MLVAGSGGAGPVRAPQVLTGKRQGLCACRRQGSARGGGCGYPGSGVFRVGALMKPEKVIFDSARRAWPGLVFRAPELASHSPDLQCYRN